MSEEKKLLLDVINKHLIGQVQPPASYTRTYFYWKKFQNVYRLFQDELEGRSGLIKVLDVGCGLGANIFFLNRDFGKEHNLEFYGVDLDPLKIYYCDLKKQKYQTKNFTFIVDNSECLSFSSNSFDILLSTEVLEHLKQPERALDEFYRILKPEGLAIITTPNQSTLVTKPKRLLKPILEKLEKRQSVSSGEREGSDFFTLNNNNEEAGFGHICVKGLKEWERILSESGFKIEKIKRGSLLVGTPQQDKRRAVVALTLIFEILLDRIPWFKNLSEDVIISARKPAFSL
jgi:2-polyprenyl-3-methyl-5-hydroxy-6-metoxy-1,4-benzoquinol methylase